MYFALTVRGVCHSGKSMETCLDRNCVCIVEYVFMLFLYVPFYFVCSFLPTLRGNTFYIELPVALWIFSHGYAVCIAAEQDQRTHATLFFYESLLKI